jgi:hypothetical protein
LALKAQRKKMEDQTKMVGTLSFTAPGSWQLSLHIAVFPAAGGSLSAAARTLGHHASVKDVCVCGMYVSAIVIAAVGEAHRPRHHCGAHTDSTEKEGPGPAGPEKEEAVRKSAAEHPGIPHERGGHGEQQQQLWLTCGYANTC